MNKYQKVTATWALATAALAGCSSSPSGDPASANSNIVASDYMVNPSTANVDTNGDGILDGILLDVTGDGVGDYAVIDTNGDGIGDTVLSPNPNTGRFDDGAVIEPNPQNNGGAGPVITPGGAGTGGAGPTGGGAGPTGGGAGPTNGGAGPMPNAGAGGDMSGAGAGGSAGAAGSAGMGGSAGGGNVTPPDGEIPTNYPRGNSTGCGKALPAGQVERERFRTDVATTTPDAAWLEEFNADPNEYQDRNFSVKVPAFYDPNMPYTVNIIGGGCGGDGQGYGGQAAWPDNNDSTVIHVHPNYKGGCYEDDGANNPEEAFFDVFWPMILDRYCVDTQRVFITGYSSGAWNAITLGCSRSAHIRGHGSATGGLRERRSDCQGPAAAIFASDVLDTTNPTHDVVEGTTCTGASDPMGALADGCYRGQQICTGSRAVDNSGCVNEGTGLALARALERNGCVGTETVPWGGTVDDIPIEQGGVYRYVTFINEGDPGDPIAQEFLDAVSDWFPVAADGRNTIPACHKFVGCPAEFPVVWCDTYDNGHGGKDPIVSQPADDGLTGYQRFFEQDTPRYE